jgi:hypothetical protein
MMWIVARIMLLVFAFGALTLAKPAVAQVRANNDWVSMWALNGQSDQAFAKKLRSEIKMRVRVIDRICELDESQKAKLQIAADADVTRFMRDIARTREVLDGMKIDNNDVNEAWQIVSPLTTRVREGMFADGSLFQKVVRSSLNKSQQGQYEAELENQRQRRWRAITRVNVAEIEKAMPLLGEQREQLLQLLDAVKVPKRLNGNMDGYIGYLRLIKVNREDLEEFLDEHQLAVLDQYRDRYKGWAHMFQ